jgi:ribosome-associated protein
MQTRGAPTGATNRVAKTAIEAVDATLSAVIASLEDSKAEEVVTIDIHGKSALGDFMVIASGRSHRHVGAIADHLLRDLKDRGLDAPRVEGMPNCDWVLIDTGDIIIHLFRPEVREFYGIEKMWQVPEPQEVH